MLPVPKIGKNSAKFALLLSSALMLSACADNHYSAASLKRYAAAPAMVSTEKLLQADAMTLSSGEVQQGAYDPAALHAAAKKRVQPNQTRGILAYTAHPRRKDMAAEKKVRVLELKKNSDLFGADAFSLASATLTSAVSKPARKPVMGQKSVQPAKIIQVAAKKPAVKPQAKPQYEEKIIAMAPGVTNLRMGDYEDKTRLVLDLNTSAKYEYTLSNLDNRLTVHVDGAGWNLESRKYFDNHPLIKSYEVEKKGADDIMLHIALKKPSKMLMSGFVRPDDTRGHRIFFDVAAL